MSFYSNAAKTAAGLIKKFGQPVSIKRYTRAFDEETSKVISSVTETLGFSAVLLPLNKNSYAGLDDRLVELAVKGKVRKLLIAAAGAPFAPEALHVAMIGSKPWILRGCAELNPAGTPVLYFTIVELASTTGLDAVAIGEDMQTISGETMQTIAGETQQTIS